MAIGPSVNITQDEVTFSFTIPRSGNAVTDLQAAYKRRIRGLAQMTPQEQVQAVAGVIWQQAFVNPVQRERDRKLTPDMSDLEV